MTCVVSNRWISVAVAMLLWGSAPQAMASRTQLESTPGASKQESSLSRVAGALWNKLVEVPGARDETQRTHQVPDLITHSKSWVVPAPLSSQASGASEQDESVAADKYKVLHGYHNYEVLYGHHVASTTGGPHPELGWRKTVGFFVPGDRGQAKHAIFKFGGGEPTEYQATRQYAGGEEVTLRISEGGPGGSPVVDRWFRKSRHHPCTSLTQEEAKGVRLALGARDEGFTLRGEHPTKQRLPELVRLLSEVRTKLTLNHRVKTPVRLRSLPGGLTTRKKRTTTKP